MLSCAFCSHAVKEQETCPTPVPASKGISWLLSSGTNTGRSEAPPRQRKLTTRFICKLLPAATSKTSPHPATHLADPLLGQGAGRSTLLHSKPPISHTPALATNIFVPTPRAALNYFAESHFHIPPSNSPPRSHQSLSAFTLQ